MSDDLDEKPTIAAKVTRWFHNLLKDPLGTMIDSAMWIFMLGIGVSIAAMFAKMGWNMIQGAWE